MTRSLPFTEQSLKRAINAARKAGMRLVVQRDGSMTFVNDDKPDNPQPEIDLEQEQDVVL